jgi:hypothetical protein
MQKFSICFLVLLFVCSLAWQALAAPERPKPVPPDYFPLRKDYWWRYQSDATTGASTFKVLVVAAELQPDQIVWWHVHTESAGMGGANASSAAGFDDWYTKPKGWVLVHRQRNNTSGQTGDYLPPRQLLQNPLAAGQIWSWNGTGTFAGIGISETNVVSGPEDVIVPAGKFRCLKVSTEVVQGGSPVKKIYWYAPGVGLVQSGTESGGVLSLSRLIDYSFRPKPGKQKLAERQTSDHLGI